jgi:cytidylate kinase
MQVKAPGPEPWAVFDRNLVETILQEHNLPARISRFMPEDRVPDLVDALDELLGLHPPVWTLLQQTVKTISRLADRGNSILIGRGAHIITSGRENVFHVRLVSSLAKRVEHIQAIRGVDRHEALSIIRKEDRGRQRYLKKYFDKDIDDPLSYHLVVNTEFISYHGAARVIAEAALDHFGATEKALATNSSPGRTVEDQWSTIMKQGLLSDLP